MSPSGSVDAEPSSCARLPSSSVWSGPACADGCEFSVEIESQLMEKVLDKQDPQVVARNWLKANPAILERWLDGVTTFNGDDGLSAVRRHIGL